jgi:Transposase DDE domain
MVMHILQTKEGLVSFSTSVRSLPQQFGLVLASFLQKPGLPFADVLREETIQAAFQEEGADFGQEDDAVYTPAITLWTFLSQVFFKEEQRSCVAAVSRLIVLLVSLGRKPCSENTGAYCRARAKLPEAAFRRIVYQVADGCEDALPDEWRWKRRRAFLVDGCTVSMPDTPENQVAYPQPNTQQEGVGFPLARLVVMLSLATAMVGGLAIGPYSGKETGETALFRQLFDRLRTGDVVIADCYFCSYFMFCLLMELGVDLLSRLHQKRTADFRRGQRLGPGDHIVEWPRPPRPEWMDEATYARMPATLRIREVEIAVPQPGFRVEVFVVATTLLDAQEYTRDDLADLYRERWLAELDIRAIKCSLGMDVLRCQSPEMVRKEIWASLLAYNLIRQTMLQAAYASGQSPPCMAEEPSATDDACAKACESNNAPPCLGTKSVSSVAACPDSLELERLPRQLSFTAALQRLAASWIPAPLLSEAAADELRRANYKHLAKHRVGHRPNRVEPRAIKRRPKPHKLLTQPRAEARAALQSRAATRAAA